MHARDGALHLHEQVRHVRRHVGLMVPQVPQADAAAQDFDQFFGRESADASHCSHSESDDGMARRVNTQTRQQSTLGVAWLMTGQQGLAACGLSSCG